jgi:transcriptional regulator
LFSPRSSGQVLQLVQENPFAWIVALDREMGAAASMPVRPLTVVDGRILRLAGHLPRHSPLVESLRHDSRALVLFMGPQAYVSPSWVSGRTWAPTWNFAAVQFLTEVELDEDPARLKALLEDLIGAMEQGRPGAWQLPEMGARYVELARRIIRFEARVLQERPRFKLGQDERDEVYREVSAALERVGADPLLRWMRELNPRR